MRGSADAPVQSIEQFNVVGFAFPDHDDSPPSRFEGELVIEVAPHVLLELPLPELGIRRRHSCEAAIAVAMPKTSVHEDCHSMSRQYDIGPSRQVAIVKPKPQPSGMKVLPDGKLRRCVCRTDRRHHPRTRAGIYDVCHRQGYVLSIKAAVRRMLVPDVQWQDPPPIGCTQDTCAMCAGRDWPREVHGSDDESTPYR
jgi:hypothetical protein